jgi:fermentation-respiration switch protein FrsA (DUF1100 family)
MLGSIGTAFSVVVIIYLVIVGLLYLFQSRLIYFPSSRMVTTPASVGLPFDDVSFVTDDGVRLSGWYVPSASARGTVVYFHGNGGNISYCTEMLRVLHAMDVNVFIFDYRGYGDSEGLPTEEGTYRDADAAWRYLVEKRHIPPRELVLYGHSLGGAIASWLAARREHAALVLESAFTSAADVGANAYPWIPVRLLIRFRYPTKDHLQSVDTPVLVIHSRSDEIIPFHHGEALFKAARGRKQFLEIAGGHNDGPMMSTRQFSGAVRHFLDEALP